MQTKAISLINVNKWFDKFHVLKDINLTVNTGEKVVICGPSGSGKSTVVRCINKLEEHQSGSISLYGKELKNTQESINSIQGNVGMVFQQFNLFPHLNVLENLILGPMKTRGKTRDEAIKIAMHYLERVHIPDQATWPSKTRIVFSTHVWRTMLTIRSDDSKYLPYCVSPCQAQAPASPSLVHKREDRVQGLIDCSMLRPRCRWCPSCW